MFDISSCPTQASHQGDCHPNDAHRGFNWYLCVTQGADRLSSWCLYGVHDLSCHVTVALEFLSLDPSLAVTCAEELSPLPCL